MNANKIKVMFDIHLVVEVEIEGNIKDTFPEGIETPEDVAQFEKQQYETGYLSLNEITGMAEPTVETLVVTVEKVN